jgi:predicted transcriptional regulator
LNFIAYITLSQKLKTRQQVADLLGISTKTLSRFLKKEGISIEPRTTLKSKLAVFIIQKYNGD